LSAPRIHAVILAGGAGERFWPASRRSHPKPFLKVVGGQSLLDATLARARRFAEEGDVWVVCGNEHAGALRRATGLPPSRVLVEPHRRNTAMAVAWAAERIAAEDPGAVMAVLPADHHIPDARRFAADIRRAARAARDAEVLVTLGVEPTRPDTGYGYIAVGDEAGSRFPRLHRVERFEEKPDLATAERYLSQGGFLWNAGVFVWLASVFLEEVETCAGELHRALGPLREKPKGRNRSAVEAAYRRAPSLPVDVAVMEPSRRVWTLPVSFAWSDVGTWSSLAEELGVGQRAGRAALEQDGNRVIEGEVLAEEAHGNLVWGGERLIALLGVEDLAIVDTEDVILITKLDRSPDVKRFVAVLKAKGREGLT
jgi:mannose-1-phosphate guanylyltransferase